MPPRRADSSPGCWSTQSQNACLSERREAAKSLHSLDKLSIPLFTQAARVGATAGRAGAAGAAEAAEAAAEAAEAAAEEEERLLSCI